MMTAVRSGRSAPEADEFALLLPTDIVDDDERRDALIDHLEAAFPGSTFRAVQGHRLDGSEAPMVVSEPLVIPVVGTAGTGAEPGRILERPSAARMRDIMATLHAFLSGPKALN